MIKDTDEMIVKKECLREDVLKLINSFEEETGWEVSCILLSTNAFKKKHINEIDIHLWNHDKVIIK
jgi:hypothetical protein